VEDKKEHQIRFSNRFAAVEIFGDDDDDDDDMDINRAGENLERI
jgi:hypothetical protein